VNKIKTNHSKTCTIELRRKDVKKLFFGGIVLIFTGAATLLVYDVIFSAGLPSVNVV